MELRERLKELLNRIDTGEVAEFRRGIRLLKHLVHCFHESLLRVYDLAVVLDLPHHCDYLAAQLRKLEREMLEVQFTESVGERKINQLEDERAVTKEPS